MLLCSELGLASSKGFIYAVLPLPHLFSSCGHIVAARGEKAEGLIPTRGLAVWALHASANHKTAGMDSGYDPDLLSAG